MTNPTALEPLDVEVIESELRESLDAGARWAANVPISTVLRLLSERREMVEALRPFAGAYERFEDGVDYGACEPDGTPLFEHDDFRKARSLLLRTGASQ